MRGKYWIIIAVVLVIAAGWFGFSRYNATKNSRPALSYATVPVSKGDIKVTVTGTGTVKSYTSRDVLPQVSGTVSEDLIKVGDKVKAGQVLARLSNDDVVSLAEQSRIDLETAKLKLADMINPSTTPSAPSDIELAKLKVRQSELNLAARQADVDSLVVTSPIHGKVSEINVQPGDDVSPGTILATVLDDSSLYLVATIHQVDAAKVAVGQKASIYFETLGAVRDSPYVSGVVTKVAAEGFNTGKYNALNVTIELDNPSGLKPGLSGYANIYTADGGTVGGSGTLIGVAREDIKAKVSGTVGQVLVKEGYQVQAGQKLLVLTSNTLQNALEQAKNDLAMAKINLNKLLNPDTKVYSEVDIEAQKLKVRQLELALQNREKDVANLTITAPIDGIVVAKNYQAGDLINSGSKVPLVTIADYGKMSVDITVDELDISNVKVGQKATLEIDAAPQKTYQATVTQISPQGTNQAGVGSFTVTMDIENPVGLRGGMTADATILVQEKPNVLLVPVEALSPGNQPTVRVLTEEGIKVKPVTVGLKNNFQAEITSGLTEGEQVVISSQGSRNQGTFGGFPGFREMGGARPQGPAGSGSMSSRRNTSSGGR